MDDVTKLNHAIDDFSGIVARNLSNIISGLVVPMRLLDEAMLATAESFRQFHPSPKPINRHWRTAIQRIEIANRKCPASPPRDNAVHSRELRRLRRA